MVKPNSSFVELSVRKKPVIGNSKRRFMEMEAIVAKAGYACADDTCYAHVQTYCFAGAISPPAPSPLSYSYA